MTASSAYSSSTFLVGFVAGVFILFTIGIVTERDIRYMGNRSAQDPADATEQEGTMSDDEAGALNGMSAVLVVGDQSAGMMASVRSVEMNVPGWAVIHEIEGGHVLNALGASRLDAGLQEDVAIELLRAMEPGGSYAVILYTDNGNKEFEIRGDLPVIDMAGNPVMKTFRTFGGAASH